MEYVVRLRAAALLCVAGVLAGTGCTPFLSPQELRYPLPQVEAGRMSACFTSVGGACPVESGTMVTALSADYFAELEASAQQAVTTLRVSSSPAGGTPLEPLAGQAIANAAGVLKFVAEARSGDSLSSKKLADTQASILTAVANDAFDEFAVATQQTAAGTPLAKTGAFVAGYVKAYFRSGRFGKITLDPTKVKERITAQLQRELAGKLTDEQIAALAEKLTEKFSPKDFGVVSDESFVARGGKVYQFKEITLGFTPSGERPVSITKIDGVEVVAELVRVVFEAMFDARHALPAVANATGIKSGLGLVENRVCTPEEQQADPARCSDIADRILTDAQFAKIESIASQVDGATLAVAGSYLRGASWFSLNNEYIATTLETAIAVTARKSAEKVVWCYYRCKPVDVLPTSADDYFVPMRTQERAVTR